MDWLVLTLALGACGYGGWRFCRWLGKDAAAYDEKCAWRGCYGNKDPRFFKCKACGKYWCSDHMARDRDLCLLCQADREDGVGQKAAVWPYN